MLRLGSESLVTADAGVSKHVGEAARWGELPPWRTHGGPYGLVDCKGGREVVMDIPEYSPTVLYDIFYETGTRLIGRYVHLERRAHERGDEARAIEYVRARRELRALRASVDVDDRTAQKQLIKRWDEQYAALARQVERVNV